jgi:drug/metabolite transporter (DMT)-like permease
MKQTLSQLDTGVKYMLIASLLFAIMGAFAKLASESMSSLEVVFFRNIFGVVLVGITILKTPLKQTGGRPLLLFF